MNLKKYSSVAITELLFISVALFFVYIPSALSVPFDQQRIFELEIIVLNLSLGLLSSSFRQSLLVQFFYFSLTTRLLLLLLLLLAIFSSIFAPLNSYAFLLTCVYISLFLLSLGIASSALQKTFFFQSVLFTALVSSCFFYQITFFTGYFASFVENIPLQWPELFRGFSNIRLFNQYHLWIYFLIATPILSYPQLSSKQTNSIKVLAIGWVILLFVSGSRGAIGAIFLTLLICAIIFKKAAQPFIKQQCSMLLFGFIGFLLLFKLLPALTSSEVVVGWRSVEQITSDAPRLYLWKLALSYMIDHPWLGVGPMHYAYYHNLIAAHPHNSLLQWGAEMGLPSLIILVTLVAQGSLAWIKGFNQLDKNAPQHFSRQQVWIALFCTMSVGLIYSLVDGVIVMPVSQVLMVTIAGWMFGLYFQSKPTATITKQTTVWSIVFASVVLAVLICLLMPNLLLHWQGLDPIATRPHPEVMHPGFWQQGEIPY